MVLCLSKQVGYVLMNLSNLFAHIRFKCESPYLTLTLASNSKSQPGVHNPASDFNLSRVFLGNFLGIPVQLVALNTKVRGETHVKKSSKHRANSGKNGQKSSKVSNRGKAGRCGSFDGEARGSLNQRGRGCPERDDYMSFCSVGVDRQTPSRSQCCEPLTIRMDGHGGF